MSTTAGILTPIRPREIIQIPAAAGTTMYAGNLVVIDATRSAVLASDTAGLKTVGRLEQDVINGLDYTGHAYTMVQRNCFPYANSATHPLAQADLGSMAMVEDEQTVAKTGVHSIKAGVFLGFDPYITTRSSTRTRRFRAKTCNLPRTRRDGSARVSRRFTYGSKVPG